MNWVSAVGSVILFGALWTINHTAAIIVFGLVLVIGGFVMSTNCHNKRYYVKRDRDSISIVDSRINRSIKWWLFKDSPTNKAELVGSVYKQCEEYNMEEKT